jgi:hypothetical protein
VGQGISGYGHGGNSKKPITIEDQEITQDKMAVDEYDNIE